MRVKSNEFRPATEEEHQEAVVRALKSRQDAEYSGLTLAPDASIPAGNISVDVFSLPLAREVTALEVLDSTVKRDDQKFNPATDIIVALSSGEAENILRVARVRFSRSAE